MYHHLKIESFLSFSPQEHNSTTISIRPFLSLPLVCSLHQDGEGAAHDTLSLTEGVQHRSEPADQTQSTRSHHQLLPHPHLPAAHLHHRLAHVTPKDDNRPIARSAVQDLGQFWGIKNVLLMMQHMLISWNDSRAALIFLHLCLLHYSYNKKHIFDLWMSTNLIFLYWYILVR